MCRELSCYGVILLISISIKKHNSNLHTLCLIAQMMNVHRKCHTPAVTKNILNMTYAYIRYLAMVQLIHGNLTTTDRLPMPYIMRKVPYDQR